MCGLSSSGGGPFPCPNSAVIRYLYVNMKEVAPMPYTIRHNARTAHLQGVANRTVYTGDGEDNGSGVVPYYAESACAALTRSGHRMAVADEVDTLADALDALRYFAE